MIELNADIGEGCSDAGLMPYVARVSIACGGHTGDQASMRAALTLARDAGVAAGAHPSYPDREHFGRRSLAASPEDIVRWIEAQTALLAEQAEHLGMRLAHVKPHGALYNDAAANAAIAEAVAEGIARFDATLAVVGLAGGALLDAARRRGLSALSEAFADRRYHRDGRLVSRETAGAVLEDPSQAAAQAYALARGASLLTYEGVPLRIEAQTLCVHGDSPQAINIARAIHAALNPA